MEEGRVEAVLNLAVPFWNPEPNATDGVLDWKLSSDQMRPIVSWRVSLEQAPTRLQDGVVLEFDPSDVAAAPKVLAFPIQHVDNLQWTADGVLDEATGPEKVCYLNSEAGLTVPSGCAPRAGPGGRIADGHSLAYREPILLFLCRSKSAKPEPLTKPAVPAERPFDLAK